LPCNILLFFLSSLSFPTFSAFSYFILFIYVVSSVFLTRQSSAFLSVACLCSLLQGDLEQLTIVPSPSAVSQQCSATRIPLLDPALLQGGGGPRERRGRRTKGRKGVDYRHNEPAAPWKVTNELSDAVGSASPRHDSGTTELKDLDGSGDEEDLYEGSALGEGQYGERDTRHLQRCTSVCMMLLAKRFQF
jgi:hypothetical protein